jgi:hypothetical protein
MAAMNTRSSAEWLPTVARSGAYLRLWGLDPADAGPLASQPVDEIQARLDRWAASLVPAHAGESPRQQEARGRAQLLLAQAPLRWPGELLQNPPPPEMADAIQAVTLPVKRPLRQTSMTPQPIDLGPVSEVAHETWKTFDKWPVLRGLTVWLLFAVLLAAVFYVVRF